MEYVAKGSLATILQTDPFVLFLIYNIIESLLFPCHFVNDKYTYLLCFITLQIILGQE
jgi:hypothetical protein